MTLELLQICTFILHWDVTFNRLTLSFCCHFGSKNTHIFDKNLYSNLLYKFKPSVETPISSKFINLCSFLFQAKQVLSFLFTIRYNIRIIFSYESLTVTLLYFILLKTEKKWYSQYTAQLK